MLASQAGSSSRRTWLAAAAPIVGVMAFSLYLLVHTGHPFAWVESQLAWGRSPGPVAALLGIPSELVLQSADPKWTLREPVRYLDAGAAILALALAWPLARRLGWAYGSWVVVNLVVALGSGGLLSIGRIVSTLFPLFIYLGARLTPGQSVALATGFASLQGLGATLFYTWRPFF